MPRPSAPLNYQAGATPTRPSAPLIEIDRDAPSEDQLREIMGAVGKILGGWTLRAIPEEDQAHSWAYLDGENGATIVGGVGRWGIGPGRIEIRGEWPRSDEFRCVEYAPYYTDVPKITVALSRGPESIAGDIERRFLPEYLPAFEKQREALEAGDTREHHQDAVTRRLAAIIGAERLHRGYHGNEVKAPADYFTGHDTAARALDSCEIHADGEAEIKLRCNEATAAAILRLLIEPADAG
jgi:hypothetical protein